VRSQSGRLDRRGVKRFDLLLFTCELALLRKETGFPKLRKKIVAIAEALEAQSSIPMINAELALIQDVQSDEWWQDVTLFMLEQARRKLRGLVKLIEKGRKKIVYGDFTDVLGPATEVELPGFAVGLDFERFKRKARDFLRAHEDHVVVHKLRLARPLTETDLAELERIPEREVEELLQIVDSLSAA
jgi:type I restriction enzyme R subunit